MGDFFSKAAELFDGLSAGIVIDTFVAALILSMVGSAFHILIFRGKKDRESVAYLGGMMFAVSVVSMAIAFVHSRIPPRLASTERPPITSGKAILESADADHDGHVTPREAFELVRRADTGRKGYADRFDLDHTPRPDHSIVRGPDVWPPMPPGPKPAAEGPGMVACFPPSGGATGHETWTMTMRNAWPLRHPRR